MRFREWWHGFVTRNIMANDPTEGVEADYLRALREERFRQAETKAFAEGNLELAATLVIAELGGWVEDDPEEDCA